MTTRALVMSGGGPIGVAWHAGMIISLIESGVDLRAADLVVGTSAGSIVGAHLRLGDDLRQLIDDFRAAEEEVPLIDAASAPESMQKLIAGMFSAAELTSEERIKALGELALSSETMSEEGFIERVGVGGDVWPERYKCTAVDAIDGTFKAWDADSGVDLDRAIASSCAVPAFFPAITIDGRRYMDGGMRSMTNADLAAGNDKVLILTVFDPPDLPEPRVQRLRKVRDDEVAAIDAAGGTSLVVPPDAEAAAVVGVNLMDASKIVEAAEAGMAQGKREAERIGGFWG